MAHNHIIQIFPEMFAQAFIHNLGEQFGRMTDGNSIGLKREPLSCAANFSLNVCCLSYERSLPHRIPNFDAAQTKK